MFIIVNKKRYSADAYYRISGTVLPNVNNIHSMIPKDQKIQLHKGVVRGDILQPPHKHLNKNKKFFWSPVNFQ